MFEARRVLLSVFRAKAKINLDETGACSIRMCRTLAMAPGNKPISASLALDRRW